MADFKGESESVWPYALGWVQPTEKPVMLPPKICYGKLFIIVFFIQCLRRIGTVREQEV